MTGNRQDAEDAKKTDSEKISKVLLGVLAVTSYGGLKNHGSGGPTLIRRKKILAVGLALALFCGGCTQKEVNKISLFKYAMDDPVPLVAAKTVGNLVPWTMLSIGILLVFPACLAAAVGYKR